MSHWQIIGISSTQIVLFVLYAIVLTAKRQATRRVNHATIRNE